MKSKVKDSRYISTVEYYFARGEPIDSNESDYYGKYTLNRAERRLRRELKRPDVIVTAITIVKITAHMDIEAFYENADILEEETISREEY